MAGPLSSALQNEILARYFKNTTVISPAATVYVALASAQPTDAAFTEISGNAYARQACAFGSVTSGTPSYVQNSSIIAFPAVTTAAWSAVVGWGIYDAVTAGNLLSYGNLMTSLTATANTLANPTVVTTPTHGMTTGAYCIVSGSNSTPSINGIWPIDYVSATTFSLPVNCTVAGTAGTVLVPTGSVTCNVGDIFQFAASAITVNLD